MKEQRIKEGGKPVPRVMHVKPGESFILASRDHDGRCFSPDKGKEHLMLRRCDKYAYYEDARGGEAKVALYHEVFPIGMRFVSGGWRVMEVEK